MCFDKNRNSIRVISCRWLGSRWNLIESLSKERQSAHEYFMKLNPEKLTVTIDRVGKYEICSGDVAPCMCVGVWPINHRIKCQIERSVQNINVRNAGPTYWLTWISEWFPTKINKRDCSKWKIPVFEPDIKYVPEKKRFSHKWLVLINTSQIHVLYQRVGFNKNHENLQNYWKYIQSASNFRWKISRKLFWLTIVDFEYFFSNF